MLYVCVLVLFMYVSHTEATLYTLLYVTHRYLQTCLANQNGPSTASVTVKILSCRIPEPNTLPAKKREKNCNSGRKELPFNRKKP